MAVKAVKTNYTLTLDKSTKDKFDELCEKIGISMSAAINAMIKQAIRRQGMSFSLVDENGFSAREAADIKKRITEAESGKVIDRGLIEE